MAEKTRVAVVMGGISTEYEISIVSGTNVCNVLPRERILVRPVVINKDATWRVGDWLSDDEKYAGLGDEIAAQHPAHALASLVDDGIDVAFIALHGPGGEDGTIQGFFQTAGIAHTGSGVLGNAVGMDKIITKSIVAANGFDTAKHIAAMSAEILKDVSAFAARVEDELGLPCVVKISNEGSSRNIDIPQDRAALEKALASIAAAGGEMLIEEFIKGREVTCAVIDKPGEDYSIALPPTELVPKSNTWFDYHAKYTDGATDEITPARITSEETAEVQRIALAVHKAVHCGGMSRTDMMMRNGRFYVIEINTIPGLTGNSLIPQAAAAAGISFPELLEIQVRWALQRSR